MIILHIHRKSWFFCKGLIDGDKKSKLNVGPTNLPKTKAVIDEEKMRYNIAYPCIDNFRLLYTPYVEHFSYSICVIC